MTRQAAQQRHGGGRLGPAGRRALQGRQVPALHAPGPRRGRSPRRPWRTAHGHDFIGTEHVLLGLYAAGDRNVGRGRPRPARRRPGGRRGGSSTSASADRRRAVRGHIRFTPRRQDRRSSGRCPRGHRRSGTTTSAREHIAARPCAKVEDGIAVPASSAAQDVTSDTLRPLVEALAPTRRSPSEAGRRPASIRAGGPSGRRPAAAGTAAITRLNEIRSLARLSSATTTSTTVRTPGEQASTTPRPSAAPEHVGAGVAQHQALAQVGRQQARARAHRQGHAGELRLGARRRPPAPPGPRSATLVVRPGARSNRLPEVGGQRDEGAVGQQPAQAVGLDAPPRPRRPPRRRRTA